MEGWRGVDFFKGLVGQPEYRSHYRISGEPVMSFKQRGKVIRTSELHFGMLIPAAGWKVIGDKSDIRMSKDQLCGCMGKIGLWLDQSGR